MLQQIGMMDVVKHWDAVNNGWQLNYPMEQSQQQTFNVVWTQAYNKSGTKLDSATWGTTQGRAIVLILLDYGDLITMQ